MIEVCEYIHYIVVTNILGAPVDENIFLHHCLIASVTIEVQTAANQRYNFQVRTVQEPVPSLHTSSDGIGTL